MDCPGLLILYNNNDTDGISKIAAETAQGIDRKTISILDVVTNLKDLLTSVELSNRKCAVAFLTSVLALMDRNVFNAQEINCLLDFYVDRSKDDPDILEHVLTGFINISTHSAFEFASAQRIFHLLQNEVTNKTVPTPALKIYYNLVCQILDSYMSEFADSGPGFVFAFLSIVDNETHSGVLEIVFRLYERISRCAKFVAFKEDIFEAMAGYFPIIYSKETDPSFLEVKKKIQSSLVSALTSSNAYSDYAFSLALEKLDTVSTYSRISSYELLHSCFTTFTWSESQPYANEIWTNIRIDTLKSNQSGDDKELIEAALLVLVKMSSLFDSFVYPEEVLRLFKKIWDDLKVALETPSLKLVRAATIILIAFAFTSENYPFQKFVYESMIETLFSQYLASDNDDDKSQCLGALKNVFTVRVNGYSDHQGEVAILNKYLPQVIEESLVKSTSTNMDYLCKILCSLMKIKKLDFLVETCSDFLRRLRQLPDFFIFIESYFHCIETFCELSPYKMTQLFVDPLLSEMEAEILKPDFFLSPQSELNLQVLLSCAKQPKIFVCLVDFLSRVLTKLSTNSEKQRYILLILDSFTDDQYGLVNELSIRVTVTLFAEKFAPQFMQFIFDEFFLKDECLDSFVIVKLNSLLKILLHMNTHYQSREFFNDLFFNKDISKLAATPNSPKSYSPLVLSKLSDSQLSLYFFILNAYLCAAPWLVTCNSSKMVEFMLDEIDSLSIQDRCTSRTVSSIISGNIISMLSNFPQQDIHRGLVKILDYLDQKFGDRRSVLRTELLTGLVLLSRTEPIRFRESIFKSLVDSLDDHTYDSSIIIKLFHLHSNTILDFYETAFLQIFKQKNPFTPTSLPFSQKFAAYILTGFSLNGFCSLFTFFLEFYKNAPKEFFLDEHGREFCSQYLPAILKGLNANVDEELSSLNCFNLLKHFLSVNPKLFGEYLTRITDALVYCAIESSTFRIRRGALLFLVEIVQQFKDHQSLLSLKDSLLRKIRGSLSDSNRLVRTVAANLNVRICMLGQPGY